MSEITDSNTWYRDVCISFPQWPLIGHLMIGTDFISLDSNPPVEVILYTNMDRCRGQYLVMCNERTILTETEVQ